MSNDEYQQKQFYLPNEKVISKKKRMVFIGATGIGNTCAVSHKATVIDFEGFWNKIDGELKNELSKNFKRNK